MKKSAILMILLCLSLSLVAGGPRISSRVLSPGEVLEIMSSPSDFVEGCTLMNASEVLVGSYPIAGDDGTITFLIPSPIPWSPEAIDCS